MTDVPERNGYHRDWPPMILAAGVSRLILVRDFILTGLMWLIFLAMLQAEFTALAKPWLDRVGVREELARWGWAGLGVDDNPTSYLYALAPYLAVAFLLVIFLGSFTIDTLVRRRAGLRGPLPPRLNFASEARHAELGMRTDYAAPDQEQLAAEPESWDSLDPRKLLLMLDKLDQSALTEARQLRVTRVRITKDGHYHISPHD